MRFYKYILLLVMCVLAFADANAQSDRQFIRNGNRLYRQQNYAKAEIEYRKALSKNPSNPQALYNLGTALLMQQKDSAAVAQLQNAAKCETSKLRKAKVWHNVGVACQKHKLFSDAIKAYEESLRNNPSDNETRYNLALCMRQQKNQKNQDKRQNKNKDKQKQNKNDKNNKDKNQNQQQQQKQQEKMSKDNAEQLLNYAEQEERQTQQRLKKHEMQPQRKRLEKNW